jgi:hypothetical protein
MSQGWITSHRYSFLTKDLWLKKLKKSKLFTKKERYIKQKQGISDKILKLTNFLPEKISFPYRIRVLRKNWGPDDVICPVCGDLKKPSRDLGLFLKTCGRQDEKHKKYYSDVVNKTARKMVWKNRSEKEKKLIELKKKKIFFEKYGVSNPRAKEYNRKKQFGEKYTRLTKKIIEEEYINSRGHFNSSKFITDLGCSYTTSLNILKEFGVSFNRIRRGFNPRIPGYLYYIKDTTTGLYKLGITNISIKERFKTKFKEIKIIKTWYFADGADAYELEQFLLEEFSGFKIINENFSRVGGKTEFFTRDILGLDEFSE